MTDDSTVFFDWVEETIQFGLDCLDVSSGEMLAFIQYQSGDRNSISIPDIQSDNGSAAARLKHARELIAELDDAEHYSLLWSGTVPGDKNAPLTVIAIEAGSRSGTSLFFTQPYMVDEEHQLVKAGKPRIPKTGVENIWMIREGIARATNAPATESAKPRRTSARRFDPITTLDDLAERAIQFALRRMQEGFESPFLCLVASGSDQGDVIPSDAADGDFQARIDALRQRVLDADDAALYAIIYFATTTVDGQEIDAVIAETGNRHGFAPVYSLTFEVSKSCELTVISPVEIVEEIENLWRNES